MGIREDRSYMQQLKADRQAIKENAERQAAEDFNNAIIAHEDKIAAHESALDRYYKYKDDVKKTLVETALGRIYTGSFHNISNREKALCENLLDQYVTETTVQTLMKNMKHSDSGLLRTIAEKVDEYSKSITADANADDVTTQTISPEQVDSFWNDIEKSDDVEDITNLIRMRVSNAEEQFVNKNQEDKEDVKTVLKQTASRVAMAKQGLDNDYAESVEESETRLAKNQIYKIQHEGYHNVFDRMVRNLSEAVINNEDAKGEYICENGRLNVEKIVESARCMYTLLEMVGTIQLENVDGQYIEDTLKSIK